MEKHSMKDVAEFLKMVGDIKAKEETEETKGLMTNYPMTPGGTCCSKCGVLGKHYLPDKQPLLYLYKRRWTCERCIKNEQRGNKRRGKGRRC